MTIRLNHDLISALDCQHITPNDVWKFYCLNKINRGQCPQQRGETCQACRAALKTIVDYDTAEADDPRGLIIWRMIRSSQGDLSFWVSEPKSPVKRYHNTTNPLADASQLVKRTIRK
jgi:hypothetical protein